VLLVVADAVEVAECGLRRGVRGFCRVVAQIVNDRSGGGESVGVIVEPEPGQLSNAELFAQDARGVVVLKGPVFDAAFDASRTVKKRSFRRFEKLLRAR